MSIITGILFSFLISITATANNQLDTQTINTIRDIPWKYTGYAGDLFQKKPVTLEISELISTTTESTSFGEIIYNKIKGKILVGDKREILLTDVNIMKFSKTTNHYSLVVKTSDEFIKSLILGLKYDLINDSFRLYEENHQGMRPELKLQGKH